MADVQEDGVIEIPSDEEATDSDISSCNTVDFESDAEEHVEVSDEETSLVEWNLASAHAFIRH